MSQPSSKTFPPATVAARLENQPATLQATWTAIVRFAETVRQRGGTAYVIGGAVRDLLLHQPPKEFDIEVHRLPPDVVEQLAKNLGNVSSVGQSFGILKVQNRQTSIDVSLPRHDTKTGAGHHDFSVGIDPMMGVPAAAQRRDFTIGAVYLDILTGQLEDPFGGIADITGRRLRIVDKNTFSEDPLRFLRALQLTARFQLNVEPETLTVLRELVPSLGHLSTERTREEWKKLMLTSKPSAGLQLGRVTGYFEQWHPEVSALWATPQDPKEHPEGTVWEHTLLTVDQAAKLATQERLAQLPTLVVVLGALTHDFGKPSMTRSVEGVLRSDGHEAVGISYAQSFLERIGFEEKIITRVLPLVSNHHRLHLLFHSAAASGEIAFGPLRRLMHEIRPATFIELLLVTAADQLGRGPFPRPDGLVAAPERYDGLAWGKKVFQAHHLDQPLDPILSGRDLVERSWPTGPLIGEAVMLAEQLSWVGFSRTEILDILSSVDSPVEAVDALRSLVIAENH